MDYRRIGPTLDVEPWNDPHVIHTGHPADDDYVTEFWLPIIGPTSYVLLREIVQQVNDSPWQTPMIDLVDTAQRVGIGHEPHTNSQLAKSLNRLENFDLIRFHVSDPAEIRTHLPDLPNRLARKLKSHTRRRAFLTIHTETTS